MRDYQWQQVEKYLRLQGTGGRWNRKYWGASVLTLSFCVRAATPLAWIMAMKMGMSPKGLPFPPAMLTPRASFGPWNKAKPNICSEGNSCSGYGNNWLLWLVEQGENGFDTHISSPKSQAHIQHPTANTNNAAWLVRNAAKMTQLQWKEWALWMDRKQLTDPCYLHSPWAHIGS